MLRVKGCDYSGPGAYFVTVCALRRRVIFGEVISGEMRQSVLGEVVAETWRWLERRHDYVHLDAWVVMPYHLYGIISITDEGAGRSRTAPTNPLVPWAVSTSGLSLAGPEDFAERRTAATNAPNPPPAVANHSGRKVLGRLVAAFKTVSTKRINELRGTPGATVWQRNYYEHIVRSSDEGARIRRYILENLLNWTLDRENPGVPEVVGAEEWEA